MAVTLDIAADFVAVCDNTQAATVRMIRGAEKSEVSIADALESMTKRDKQLIESMSINGGVYSIWCIPDSQLNPAANGREIQVKDEIVLPGRPDITLVVQSAEPRSLGSVTSYWWCLCRERR